MIINNLKVDADAIGAGFYDIICEKGEESLVAFGMIPKWTIDMAEGMIREKIVREAARQVGCTAEELAPIVDKKVVDDMTAKIIKAVCVAIYKTASERGKMIV